MKITNVKMALLSELADCHCLIESAAGKFLCFTRLSRDTMILCASDGLDLWKVEMDPADLDAHREITDTPMDVYLNKIRTGLNSGDLIVTQQGVKCTLTVGHGPKAVIFELYEAKVAAKKTELQNILFNLAARTSDLESQLAKANKTIDGLKQQKAVGGGAAGIFDLGEGKKGKVQPKPTAKVGMSVVNPGSKKRKAAKGIAFD